MTITRHEPEPPLTPDEARAYLEEMSEKWSHLVTSYGWQYVMIWSPNLDGMPDGCEKNNAAQVEYRYQYLHASITFNLQACTTHTKDGLEEIMIHELTHLLLAPMRQKNTQENNELCTTMISRIFKDLQK